MSYDFIINHSDKKTNARQGTIKTPNGNIETPAFIFCATHGTIKGLTSDQMKLCKTQIVLSNTYHLEVFPGSKRIKEMGGLHKCMNWKGPILTDSGGYQIFAMGHGSVSKEIKGSKTHTFTPTLKKISDNGAEFISYRDKSKIVLTPEKSIQIQRDLGTNFVVCFDECTPFNVSKEYVKLSMERSNRWAVRCIKEFNKHDDGTQALYGIVQGSIYPDLRKESVDFINEQNFFGVAIGGSLGDCKKTMYETVRLTMKFLKTKKPVHLLGIGGIQDIFNGVENGIDTFDCVHPTRIARHGCALIKPINNNGKEFIDISKGKYKNIHSVIDLNCSCPTCKNGDGYLLSYLNYLIKIGETVYGSIIMMHNVYFMNQLMEDIRFGIKNDLLEKVKFDYLGFK